MSFIRRSIRNKMVVFLIITIAVPILSSVAISYYYSRAYFRSQFIGDNMRLVSQGRDNLQNYMENINRASLFFYNNSLLMKVITQEPYDYISGFQIYAALQSICNQVNDIRQVYYYIYKTNYSYLYTYGNFKKSRRNNVPVARVPDNMPIKVLPQHWSSSYGINQSPEYSPEKVITFNRFYYNIPNMKVIGSLSIDVKLDKIRELCANLYKNPGESIYIVNHQGKLIYASDEGKVEKYDWLPKVTEGNKQAGYFRWSSGKKSGLIIFNRLENKSVDWFLVKYVSDSRIYENAENLLKINMILAVLFLIVVILLTSVVSFHLMMPLKTLTKHVTRIKEGHMDEKILVTSSDELGLLSAQFSQMMDTINHYVISEYKLKLANKTSQLKVLQAQINPHFINNSLQSIATLALKNDVPEVYHLISLLGQMMSYSMDTKEMLVPLLKEMDHVEYYLKLQKQRFGDELVYELKIDERAKHIVIPKMIIQPVVENFFMHGYGNLEEAGFLRIAAEVVGEVLQITIEDNGRGMDEDKLQKLVAGFAADNLAMQEPNQNIGLASVKIRLMLYYGGKSSMHFHQRKPSGFCVSMEMPLSVGEELS